MSHERSRASLFAVFALVIAGFFAGCGDDPVEPLPNDTLAPNFTLQDYNPNSASFNALVSTRQQMGQVSAWYFGHAT